MKFTFTQSNSTYEDIQELRKNTDCILIDHKKMKSQDLFMVDDPEFDRRLQPLRLVVVNLSELDPYWKILNDPMKRNTMVISPDDEVRAHPDIVRLLESMGVALLMSKRNESHQIDLEGLTKSLKSLRFERVLVEDTIDLIPELTQQVLINR